MLEEFGRDQRLYYMGLSNLVVVGFGSSMHKEVATGERVSNLGGFIPVVWRRQSSRLPFRWHVVESVG